MINHSQNCFGCIGFSTGHKEYCILNKQYTQEEYEDLLPKITEKMQSDPSTSSGQGPEWGEFFPVSLSPFAYNETVAHEYMPLTKEEVESYGWRWLERMPEQEKRPEESVTPPDAISDTDDTLCEKVLTCEASSKPYRIIPQELAFYKKQGIPVPQRSPDQRHRDRIALRNPRRMWKRKCVKCETEIQTSYASDRAERVYCEDCYLKEVY